MSCLPPGDFVATFSWIKTFRCPNDKCQAFVTGRFCKFCGSELPQRKGVKQVLGYLSKPIRVLVSFAETAFIPWKIGAYLRSGRKGAISGPREMLGYTLAFFVGNLARIMSQESPDRELMAFLYVGLGVTVAYIMVLFHSLLKSFGSARTLFKTFEAAAYPLALTSLVLGILLFFNVAFMSCPFADIDECNIPAWQTVVAFLVYLWMATIMLVIQAQVHSLRWYKVFLSIILTIPVVIGWEYFAYTISMSMEEDEYLQFKTNQQGTTNQSGSPPRQIQQPRTNSNPQKK